MWSSNTKCWQNFTEELKFSGAHSMTAPNSTTILLWISFFPYWLWLPLCDQRECLVSYVANFEEKRKLYTIGVAV